MHTEKRKHTRLTLHSKASIRIGDRSIEAESENLSLNGAFIAAVSPVELNDLNSEMLQPQPVATYSDAVAW